MKSKLNEKKAKEIIATQAKKAAEEQQWNAEQVQDRQSAGMAMIAQDPIDALFDGIRFRDLISKAKAKVAVRDYCYKQIGDNWKAAVNKHDSETSQLRSHIRALEEAMRTAKRRNAEDVVEAIAMAHRSTAWGNEVAKVAGRKF
jgi:hemerythrin-like domain-containing protein